MAEKLSSEYHLFFIIPSSSFIHGRNLERFEQEAQFWPTLQFYLFLVQQNFDNLPRFLNTIDHLEPTYIGQKTGLGSNCGIKAGILLSRPLLLKVDLGA